MPSRTRKPPPWSPDLTPKQWRLLQTCKPEGSLPKYILTSGPRKSAKTIGCLHAVCQHAWETPYAAISMLGPTTSFGTDGGCWVDLTKSILPNWIEADFGFKWVVEPKIDGATKRPYCVVLNQFKHPVKIQMDSLQHEKEVEERFKNKRFSMLYVAELSYFKRQKTFDILKETLRQLTPQGRGLPEQYHLMLCDTNPADEGEDSWIYRLWYSLRTATSIPPEWREMMTDGEFLNMQWQLRLIEMMVEDNTFLKPEEVERLRIAYPHDKDLHDRYYLGRWVKASTSSVFSEVFRPNFHIVGSKPTPVNPNPPMMVPQANCSGLIGGWDPGPMNCSAHILEEVMLKRGNRVVPGYKVLDELVWTDGDSTLDEFVERYVELMDFWEGIIRRERPTENIDITWRHYADSSAFDSAQYRTKRSIATEVLILTKKRIVLRSAEKGVGSVGPSVDLVKRLLFQDRLRINNARCPRTIEMFQSIPKGKGGLPVSRVSKHKHCFDSLRYPLMECLGDELQRAVRDIRVGGGKSQAVTIVPA